MPHTPKDLPKLTQKIFDAIVCAVDEEVAELVRQGELDEKCHACDHVIGEVILAAMSLASGYYNAECAMAGVPRPIRDRCSRLAHRNGMRIRQREHLKSCSSSCKAHKIVEEELAEQN